MELKKIEKFLDLNHYYLNYHNTPKKQKSASEKYQMLSHIEHIKKLPDTYIGSVVPVESERYVYNEETKSMILQNLIFTPVYTKYLMKL